MVEVKLVIGVVVVVVPAHNPLVQVEKNLISFLVGFKRAGLGQGCLNGGVGGPMVKNLDVGKEAVRTPAVDVKLVSLELVDKNPLPYGHIRFF